MATFESKANDHSIQISLSFLHDLLSEFHPRNFAVKLWDNSIWEAEPGQPTRFTLILKHPGSLRKMFGRMTELAMGEAYIYDDFDIEGEIEAVYPLADYLGNLHWNLGQSLHNALKLYRLPAKGSPRFFREANLSGSRHSVSRDKLAIIYHYDVSNNFYQQWLDRRMVYSCAYFAKPEEDLDLAQERKLDYICRKLHLSKGERLLDIGCGWGGLLLHAVQNYHVQALGITLSKQQADLANQRIQEAGVADRCRVEVCDYRNVNEPEAFDKLVSVGMFEHVGKALLPGYFTHAWRLLKKGGIFLNHGIANNVIDQEKSRSSFSEHYVFPDGELVPISNTLRIAENSGFEVRDVESLREHYALTLRNWVKRIEEHHEEARNATDEVTYRIWRLFMSGSAYKFQVGRLNVFQTLLVKLDNGNSGLPLTRSDLYKET